AFAAQGRGKGPKTLLRRFCRDHFAPAWHFEDDLGWRHAQAIMGQFADRRRRQRKGEPRGKPDAQSPFLVLAANKAVAGEVTREILITRITMKDGGRDQRPRAVVGTGKGCGENLIEGTQRTVVGMAAPTDITEQADRVPNAFELDTVLAEQWRHPLEHF